MTQEREGEFLMLGLAVIESWFPILSIVAMSYIGALHTYTYSLLIALVFFIILMVKRDRFKELKEQSSLQRPALDQFLDHFAFYFSLYRNAIHYCRKYGSDHLLTVTLFLLLL